MQVAMEREIYGKLGSVGQKKVILTEGAKGEGSGPESPPPSPAESDESAWFTLPADGCSTTETQRKATMALPYSLRNTDRDCMLSSMASSSVPSFISVGTAQIGGTAYQRYVTSKIDHCVDELSSCTVGDRLHEDVESDVTRERSVLQWLHHTLERSALDAPSSLMTLIKLSVSTICVGSLKAVTNKAGRNDPRTHLSDNLSNVRARLNGATEGWRGRLGQQQREAHRLSESIDEKRGLHKARGYLCKYYNTQVNLLKQSLQGDEQECSADEGFDLPSFMNNLADSIATRRAKRYNQISKITIGLLNVEKDLRLLFKQRPVGHTSGSSAIISDRPLEVQWSMSGDATDAETQTADTSFVQCYELYREPNVLLPLAVGQLSVANSRTTGELLREVLTDVDQQPGASKYVVTVVHTSPPSHVVVTSVLSNEILIKVTTQDHRTAQLYSSLANLTSYLEEFNGAAVAEYLKNGDAGDATSLMPNITELLSLEELREGTTLQAAGRDLTDFVPENFAKKPERRASRSYLMNLGAAEVKQSQRSQEVILQCLPSPPHASPTEDSATSEGRDLRLDKSGGTACSYNVDIRIAPDGETRVDIHHGKSGQFFDDRAA
ncbi:hypothetical protein FOL47_006594 [Perkinsus chesapeaki]|uniref:Uncharacterized protein n=1 Tax=Perkinsus chesapeaki TaxID=330153 RepID=A0A7J6MXD2_PERCH|nr:hypothetical protein FOL47_006594 [Perkinsus chesapeaki]